MPPNSDIQRLYPTSTNMKRRRITDDDMKGLYAGSKLSILAIHRTLLDEDRNGSEIDDHRVKKIKVEATERQDEIEICSDDGSDNESGDDQRGNKEKPKHYLDLVSSAAFIIFEERQKVKQEEDSCVSQQQEQPQEDASGSEAASNTSSRTSRSSSVCSEFSIYRSYEMELPEQPLQYSTIKARLPRPPRFPSASDIPRVGESTNNSCQLNTRCYGEQHSGLQQTINYGGNQQGIDNDSPSTPTPVLIQNVIYQ